ncbi:MAG: hypothetical protein EOP53_08270 [Sphingobacteriales bacterium]|nr:MAG: hypothetical protein EOP53_08270 [Sphingobacteriales bacterium]
MEKLLAQIQQLEKLLPENEKINPAVSKGSMGWHMEHTLLVINAIISTLKKSDPKDYKWRFEPKRMILFTFKRIFRGSVQAPEIVVPAKNFDLESLQKHIRITKAQIKTLENAKPNQHFQHPFLGVMNLEQTIKFLAIHTNHHIKIMKDILAK